LSLTVAIVDPRPAWCGALARVLIEIGFGTIRRWNEIHQALPSLLAAPPEVLILSLLSSRNLPRAQMLSVKEHSRIVLVVDRRDTMTVEDVPGIGIDAILASDASASSVAECLACVTSGRAWLDAALLQPLIGGKRAPHWDSLSLREREVALLAARGLSNKRIARTLNVSHGTVKIHMHHVLSKLGVSGRDALAEMPGPALEVVPMSASPVR